MIRENFCLPFLTLAALGCPGKAPENLKRKVTTPLKPLLFPCQGVAHWAGYSFWYLVKPVTPLKQHRTDRSACQLLPVLAAT